MDIVLVSNHFVLLIYNLESLLLTVSSHNAELEFAFILLSLFGIVQEDYVFVDLPLVKLSVWQRCFLDNLKRGESVPGYESICS